MARKAHTDYKGPGTEPEQIDLGCEFIVSINFGHNFMHLMSL